ncbi:Twin-arginine translocation pathway signal [Alteromonas mediterranea MED64]|uniref:hydroxypyruvate isomerase family protein n=1 Tax=Alteromonas mediterranea TaxID=314275 RepID=UPI00035566A9|nr:TIM barrel protein [Alteromonas mediterranea]AGP80370.1 Twin-arginine translocation pathway signal [Alteromonas mediterranea MED64]
MHNITRRKLLQSMAMTGAGIAGTGLAAAGLATAMPAIASTNGTKGSNTMNTPLKGNVNHSVSRWTYGDLSIEELCQTVKQLGFGAIDLVGPEDWPVLKQYGIDSSMCNGAEISLEDGFIHSELHDELEARYIKHIDLVADAGYTNLICFSGNARGMSREDGLENAVKGLKRILPHAEKRNVVIFMELFNSKVDHPDYMADNSAWAIELCKRLGSKHFSLLYDIYHMQINEGDIIRTIRDNYQYFGHYHTAGVPGRHEIDASQELNYEAIAKAIVETGFKGYLAQEFIPTPKIKANRIASLQQAIHICDV